MERLIILVGRLYKSVAPTKYFFKVPLVGRFIPLVGVIHWPVESPLHWYVQYENWRYPNVNQTVHLISSTYQLYNVIIKPKRPTVKKERSCTLA